MAKITPLSGFPEWPPEFQMVERTMLATLRRQFELHGFLPLETRSVEPRERLLTKGETDKEIYMLRRLQAGEGEGSSSLGLHFDLTIPCARYVAEFRGNITFPYRRYQIQKAWRGERPQEGRYREFYQADADIVGDGKLSLDADAEVLSVLAAISQELPIPAIRFLVNNRKIFGGFFKSLEVEDPTPALRIVDKLDKIGSEKVVALLQSDAGLSAAAAEKVIAVSKIKGSYGEVRQAVLALGQKHEELTQGLDELGEVFASLSHIPRGLLIADMHIARGFDYYTGTVVEGLMTGHEDLGSVCSGGRYDNLAASMGTKAHLPGVGVSFGVSRILGRLFRKESLKTSRTSPTTVLVSACNEEEKVKGNEIARTLRSRGIAAEVFTEGRKVAKQIRYAEKLGIPFVWFVESRDGGQAVRDIRQGSQETASPESWTPPEGDSSIQLLSSKNED